jgi:hypothetical protein
MAQHNKSFGKQKNHEKIFFLIKMKVLKEEVNKILENFRVNLLIEVMTKVVVKVEVIAIFINKIILPIIMHSQEEVEISVK